MKLAEMTWPEVDALDRKIIVLIPTGSLEQHGPHLPLLTDTILANSVAQAVEKRIPDKVLVTPPIWMGCSEHHQKFPGSVHAPFELFIAAVNAIVNSLAPHGFLTYYLLNGHGGNTAPLNLAARTAKIAFPNIRIGTAGYFNWAEDAAKMVMEGPLKTIRHACEGEASLVMHVRPELVRTDKLRDDGTEMVPNVAGMASWFDEVTEQGSWGYATLATPEKGKAMWEAAVAGVTAEMEKLFSGYVYQGMNPNV